MHTPIPTLRNRGARALLFRSVRTPLFIRFRARSAFLILTLCPSCFGEEKEHSKALEELEIVALAPVRVLA